MGWISVEDKLPEGELYGRMVIIYDVGILNGVVNVGVYLDGMWRYWGSELPINPEVTHWMPLPEPPKVVNDDTE